MAVRRVPKCDQTIAHIAPGAKPHKKRRTSVPQKAAPEKMMGEILPVQEMLDDWLHEAACGPRPWDMEESFEEVLMLLHEYLDDLVQKRVPVRKKDKAHIVHLVAVAIIKAAF
jgi:hypothetical protein